MENKQSDGGGGSGGFKSMSEMPDNTGIAPLDFSVPAGPLSIPWVSAPTQVNPPPGDFLSSVNQIAAAITGGAKAYYGTQADVYRAQAAAQVARAQGANAAQTARAGMPSANLLLFGGLGLVALVVLTRK